MLGGFRKLSLLLQVLSVVGAIGAAGGALWGVYAWVKHQGYVEGEAASTARCTAERASQQHANEAAIDDANRLAIRLADELTKKQTEIDDAREARDAAALADPDGGNRCLGLGSVRRLNSQR